MSPDAPEFGPHGFEAGDAPTGDAAVDALLGREVDRRRDTLQLLAGETEPTPGVRAAMASVFDAKYAEGYPGTRYHGGCDVVDELEELAITRARALFDAEYVNVQPLSGSAANLAVYAGFAQPGDPVLALRLEHGGHQTHGSRANFSGRWFSPLHYEVRPDDELVDYDQVRDLALVHRPRILVAGAASYSRTFDFAALREIADEAECILWVDAAHLAGHIAAGLLPSPVPYADIVTLSTNKVIRGPRGGVVLARAEHGEALRKAVFPFVQGGPAMHTVAAKAVACAESGADEFAGYARRTVDNARGLAGQLAARGARVVSGGDRHPPRRHRRERLRYLRDGGAVPARRGRHRRRQGRPAVRDPTRLRGFGDPDRYAGRHRAGHDPRHASADRRRDGRRDDDGRS